MEAKNVLRVKMFGVKIELNQIQVLLLSFF